MSPSPGAQDHGGTRARPPSPVDVAIAGAVFVGSLAQLAHGGVTPSRPGSASLDAIGVALAVCSSLPLIVWRSFPRGVLLTTGVAGVLLAGLDYPADLLLGPTTALYLLAASRDEKHRWGRRTTGEVGALFASYLVATAVAHAAFPAVELLHTGLAWGGAWFAGERTRLRREHLRDLRDRALRAERDGHRERLLAVAEERTRIARDLHDSAGAAITLIAVRAGAGRLRHEQDPDRSLLALEAVEQLARDTVEEINSIVATLRDGDVPSEPVEAPIGLASLTSLLAQHRAARQAVTLEVEGVAGPLGAAVDQAAYRILQEALTNAARHGVGSADVVVTYADAAIELTVTNPVERADVPESVGHGLIGMSERATLLGGTFETQIADGRFCVRARIPFGGNRT